jgi:N-acetylglucosaminyldiphosphoundecaprenol N-acetyl-beta-D-mannosaminyltransferase
MDAGELGHGFSDAERSGKARPKERDARLEILGVPVDHVTAEDALGVCADVLRSQRQVQVVTVNPEFVMAARRDPAFMTVLRSAELSLADGVGMVWASRLLGRPLPERVAGVDVLPRIARTAAEHDQSVFLLGAAPGVAERAAAALVAPGERAGADTAAAIAYGSPAAIVAGVFAGSPSDSEADSIVRMVNASGAAVLFVAFGAPAQDMWIARHRARLGPQIMMGVGGAFDFLAGERRRAPAGVRRFGLEWLWRLVREPWRWRRQLALPRFAGAVVLEALRRRR